MDQLDSITDRYGTGEVEKPPKAKPFLKWVGGKRNLLFNLTNLAPEKFSGYWEPFLGGGAFFFHLASLGLMVGGGGGHSKPQLSDINFDLFLTWHSVKNHPTRLTNYLAEHKSNHDGNGYYNFIRERHNQTLTPWSKRRSPVKIAAQTIYLNKTCFNGLYRVNSRGEFNTPRGDYVSPKILDKENIFACNEILNRLNAVITHKSFIDIAPKRGHFIYADPPYDDTFTSYSAGGFIKNDQAELQKAALSWHYSGALVMLSNSDTPHIRELYSKPPWNITEVYAPRMVSSNANTRGPVRELIIRNYKNETGRAKGGKRKGGQRK